MTPPINSEGVFHQGHVPRAPSVPRFNARDDAARLRAIALELASPLAEALNDVAGRMESGAYDAQNDAAKLRVVATRMSYNGSQNEAQNKHIVNEMATRLNSGAYKTVKDAEYTGGPVSYYKVHIPNPTSLPAHYTAECNDIIEALGMSFAEGEAFKAIWRTCAARTLGMAKKGYTDGLYDAEKVAFYGQRMVEQFKARAK